MQIHLKFKITRPTCPHLSSMSLLLIEFLSFSYSISGLHNWVFSSPYSSSLSCTEQRMMEAPTRHDLKTH